MIRFEEVTRRYEAGGRPALDDVTVEFYRGDFAFLIGASGSGKSTLLRMILREGLPQRGKVTVAGQNLGLMLDRRVPDFRRSIGMVFQDFRLLPDKTVFDNVAFAMRVLGAKRGAIRKRVTKVLEKVELAHLAKRYPHEISGGEQQRAAIARAIVNDPAILLADEPTGNLDPRASAEVMKVLRWINASGTTVIMATHDRAIVDHAQTRVVQLHRGRLVRDEAHGFYDAPEGSEAWDVLAQEESESGLRAHDPAPLKTAVAPALGSAAADGAAEHDSFQDGEHHTWEPDTQDHHFVESRDESIDHVGDHPEDQVMAPGEDPSVLAFDEDPVLQETAESSPALRERDFDHHGDHRGDHHGGNDAHLDDAGAGQHEHPGMRDERHDAWPLDAPILDEPVLDEPTRDAPMSEAAILDEPFSEGPADESSRHRGVEGETEQEPDDEFHDAADTAPDVNGDESEFVPETGFSVTWPDHLREDVHGHDVPEPHGDFDGTELPDLDQDGFTEAEEEPELEEPLTGEIMPIPQAVETDLRHHDQDLDPDLDPDQDLDQDLDPDKFTDAEQDLGAEQDPDPEQYPDPDQDLRSDLGAEPDHANGDRSGSDQDSSRSGPQGPEPSGVPLTPATPAQPRPRLSWLAHAEEESPQRPDHRPAETQAPARPIFTLDPPSPRPPRAPESRLDPVPAEDPVLDGDPADGRDPVLEQDPGLEQDPVIAEDPELNQDPELSQGPERDHHLAQEQDPAPEQDLQSQDAAEHPAASESGPEVYPVPEERPVPKPMSSASQSTYTDARRTAEHLGIPRSRRSIMRRLRRDG